RDVVFGLLDAMSSQGEAALTVRGTDRGERTARLTVQDPEQRKRLTEPSELFRGLGFQFWTPAIPAVLGQVLPDGPAARVGLKAGDQIVSIDGTPVNDFRDIVNRIGARPGESVVLTYRRDGVEHNVRVQVASEEAGGKRVGRIRVAQPSGIT